MAIITTGQTFTATGPVTNTKLQDIASKATFNDPVDETSLELIPLGTNAGKLGIKDAGVTAAKLATDALESAYPVGSIYMNATDSTDPATLLGFGTWATFGAGKVLVGIDTTDDDFDIVGSGTNTNGATGAKTVKLTSAESGLPSHTHTSDGTRSGKNAADPGGNFFSSSGDFANYGAKSINVNGAADAASFHNNLQPYVVVHMWTRTA